MPKRRIITTSQGAMFKDELEKTAYKSKARKFEETEFMASYKEKRDKVFALLEEGYTNEQIKVILKI